MSDMSEETAVNKRALLAQLLQQKARQARSRYPLSHGQRALWFLHHLAPESAAYNVSFAARIRSDLDVNALEASFQTLADRHAALRTTIVLVNGDLLQQVHEHKAVSFTVVVATDWSDSMLQEQLLMEAERPFNLAEGPLLRIHLFRLGKSEHILLVVVHHIIGDFWSQVVLVDELKTAYTAHKQGQTPLLPPLQKGYVDYVRWQEKLLQGDQGDALRVYWQEQLTGELPALDLPIDLPRPPVQTYRGAVHQFAVTADVVHNLRALAQTEGTTLFVVLLSAFQVLLHRYTRQETILVGSPASGRARSDFEALVGYFVNPLVLKGDLSGNPTFRDYLAQMREVVLGALAHQDYPFPLLVEHLQPERDPSRSPLFQAQFVLEQAQLRDQQGTLSFLTGRQEGQLQLQELTLEPLALSRRTAQFDISLITEVGDEALQGVIEYNCDLFSAAAMAQMASHFGVLLGSIVENPGKRVRALSLLTAVQYQQIVREWNKTERDYGWGGCIHELITAQAEQTPEAIALVFDQQTLTYAELNQRANQLAHYLQAQGVGPETCVGVCMERSFDMVISLLGILKAGGAYVPLDPDYPSERLAFMLSDTRPLVLLTQTHLQGRLPTHEAQVVCIDAAWSTITTCAANNPVSGLMPDNLAYVIYTSGSTGRPKGAMNTHRAIYNRLLWMQEAYPLTAEDRVLQKTPFSFDVSVWEFFWPLMFGARLIVAKPGGHKDNAYLAQLIQDQGVTTLHFVPSMLQLFVEEPEAARCPSLQRVICSGEALSRDLQERFFNRLGAELHNLYGPTEAAVDVTYWPCRTEDGLRTVPIGYPIANTQIYVLDDEMQPVAVGVAGELYIGGVNLARGYHNRAGLTAEKFVPNPFATSEINNRLYKSGDLVRHLPNGAVEFLGRLDFQVKIRGFRIELGEIEAVLAQHPAVREVVVSVQEAIPGDKRLTAYLVTDTPQPTTSELRQFVASKLPDYMTPAVFILLNEMPLNPNGKLDRSALPQPHTVTKKQYVSPQTQLEQKLATVWQDVLQVAQVGIVDNFFELGGNSLLLVRVHRRLRELLDKPDLSMVTLFQYPTIRDLARFLAGNGTENSVLPANIDDRVSRQRKQTVQDDVAIVGMAGRFPGAPDIATFWENLCAGVESITFFSEDELEAAGVDAKLYRSPDYVNAKGLLTGVDEFAASFFDINPRQAEIMDPQHRLFLECAWEALEHAGYDPERYPGLIGVYGGQSANSYLLNNLATNRDLVESMGAYNILFSNDKDYLPTFTSYKLNLKGPGINVQTACSTSLVTTALACQALKLQQIDMALAGGVSISVPHHAGYLYQKGGILSPDGHCRAFDRQAQGTVKGEGVGVVVLKRLEDALASGDTIHAIIKSIALNNDGATKVSYTAPGVQAQAEVIAMALGLANVAPEGIAYVEAHGTGTDLGDPIEVTALTQAFQRKQELPPNSIALGSVKTNIGHADAAAGIAGLIKTVMALKHRLIPPNLHFETPNPKIDFANTPFFVNKELSGWPDKLGPRRAGVSSFGIGGTNAHAVLEEAPILEPVSRSRPWQLLLLSAKTESALNTATENLVFYLRQHPEVNLADVAYTYQVGRQPFFHRRMLVCQQEIEVSDILQSSTSAGAYALVQESALNRVAFMFSGQGAQYIGMAAELYETEAIFKEWVDYCADYLRPYLGQDLRQWLYPQPGDEDEATQRLQETAVAQPALFVFEYALAKLWMHWGVAPEAMIGHSIGEYVAACLAGVFSLEDALQIVTVRGRLMQALPGGSMVAVSLPAEEVMPFLGEKLSLAAINAPEVCVVSGSHDAINAWYEQMITAGVACQLLHTSHAFHSTMMEPILATFTKEMQRMQLHPPQLPYVSNVTGDWITEADATDPAYWAKHLRQTVHFSAGLDRLVANNDFVLLEVGPGNALTRLARQSPSFTSGTVTLPSVRHPQQEQSDVAFLLNTLGQLWLAGLTIDWDSFYSHERRWRLPLPTYPFERQRYWIDPQGQSSWQFAMGSQQKRKALSNWFYTLSWLQKPLSDNGLALEPSKRWLIFVDDEGVAKRLQTRLVTAGHKVIIAQKGTEFGWNDRFYTLHPTNAHNYEALLDDLEKRRMLPDVILHMWEMTTVAEVDTKHEMNGFYSLLYLAQALAHQGDSMPRSLIVVTTGMYDVTGDEALQPQKATMLGPLKIIPQEMPYLTCRHVDFVLPQTERAAARLQEQLWQEFVWAREMVEETAVAYRGHHRWIQTVQALSLPPEPAPNRLRRQGVYLITGGLGGIGLALAAYLAETVQARLVLVNRSNFPEEMDWARLATQPHTPPKLREQINQLQALKSHGAEIWVARADVTEQDQVQAILAQVRQKFGAIHGVIHAAGVAGGGLLHLKTENEANRVLAPKVTGTRILYDALRGDALDFFVCCSSLTAVTGAVGQVDYCAANAFQDAFARAQRATNGAQIISINWPTWHETGMAAATLSNLPPVMARLRKQALAEGIATSEGVTAFAQMLPAILPQIIVSPQPLADVMNQVNSLTLPQLLQELQSDTVGNGYTRPALETAYEAPRNEIEEQVAGIYQSLLGIEGVGIYDSFFELGGHSLLATQLVAQIQEFHEVALPLQVLFNSPTVVGIVEFIETTRWAVGRGETDATPETEYEEFTV